MSAADAIEVDRVQDARIRRLPFQQKIGAGLTREQFMDKVKSGSVRHVGLAESITMIATALNWKLDRVTDDIGPKIADARRERNEWLEDVEQRGLAHEGEARPRTAELDLEAHLARLVGVVGRFGQ